MPMPVPVPSKAYEILEGLVVLRLRNILLIKSHKVCQRAISEHIPEMSYPYPSFSVLLIDLGRGGVVDCH